MSIVTALLVGLLAPAGQTTSEQTPTAGNNTTKSRIKITEDDRRRGSGGPPAATLVAAPLAMAIAGWDADGDGRTSRAELAAGVARSFVGIDVARKGRLRYLDYADWALRYLGDRNALPSPFEVDTDGDDAISLAELQAAFAGAFDRLDTDHDGYASRAELLTIRSGAGGERGEGGSGRHGKPPR